MSALSLTSQDTKLSSLGLQKTIVNVENICTYSRSLGAASESNPVLVLLHGYPQSSYMWRHLIPLLPPHAPIFAADLPGYGASARITKNDKLTVGTAVLSALKTESKRTSSGNRSSAIPTILIGHDRGARVAHRLAVSGLEGIDILGVVLIDIVPSLTQWTAFSDPNAILGFFHFPLLANVPVATKLISAYGAANWCTEMIRRWSGTNSRGCGSLEADGALAVYGGFFEQKDTIEATCEDYEAGATTDLEAQRGDQEQGRKVRQPLLLVYSGEFIGTRFDVPGEWKGWVDDGVRIRGHALGGGIGHFGAEEAPEETGKVIGEWLREVVVRYGG